MVTELQNRHKTFLHLKNMASKKMLEEWRTVIAAVALVSVSTEVGELDAIVCINDRLAVSGLLLVIRTGCLKGGELFESDESPDEWRLHLLFLGRSSSLSLDSNVDVSTAMLAISLAFP